MDDQWMSIVEYARVHGISDMTIRRRIKTGRLAAVLRDGKYYIPADARGVAPASPTPKTPAPPPSPPLVKAHPAPSRTFEDLGPTTPDLPGGIPRKTQDTQEVIALCNRLVRQAEDLTTLTRREADARQAELTAQIRARDLEIDSLRQKVHDLETLVKFLEEARARI